jgi:heptosyltransferase-3
MKKALFLKTKHIGDSIILTSAISALPADFVVDVLCFKDSEPIFRMCPRVQNVFVVPRHLQGLERIKEYFQIVKAMKLRRYDLLAQFSDDWRGAFLSRLLGIENSVARFPKKRPNFWKKSFKQLAKVTLTPRPAAEQDVDLIRKIGLYEEPVAPSYAVMPKEEDLKRISNALSVSKNNLILVHASARWKFKGISNATWAEVIDDLIGQGYSVALSGSAVDLDFNQNLINLCKKQPTLLKGLSLYETAVVANLARLVISIDSMIIHLASAFRTPVVAIFGPTDERVWAPWKTPHEIVSLDLNDAPSFICRPCGHDGCGGSKTSQCLMAINSRRILSAASRFLDS